MHGNNDKSRKAPDSERTWVHKSDLDPRRIDNFSDRIKREDERRKQNQSSNSNRGQSSGK